MAEKRKQSLVRAFMKAAAKAVAGVVLAASLLYGGWHAAMYSGRGERLTAGETQMVQDVFGSSINPSIMRKHFKPDDDVTHFVKRAIGTVDPPFSHIDFFGPSAYSQDFSKDTPFKYGLFMHESTHCWQGQHFAFPLKHFNVYPYTLTATSKWSDFGVEQQADIIEDYSKRWMYPSHVHIKHNDNDLLLARVVETQFPHAHVTRLAREAQKPVRAPKMKIG